MCLCCYFWSKNGPITICKIHPSNGEQFIKWMKIQKLLQYLKCEMLSPRKIISRSSPIVFTHLGCQHICSHRTQSIRSYVGRSDISLSHLNIFKKNFSFWFWNSSVMCFFFLKCNFIERNHLCNYFFFYGNNFFRKINVQPESPSPIILIKNLNHNPSAPGSSFILIENLWLIIENTNTRYKYLYSIGRGCQCWQMNIWSIILYVLVRSI